MGLSASSAWPLRTNPRVIPGVCAVRGFDFYSVSAPLYRPTAHGRPNLRRRPFDGRSVARGPPCRDELPGQGHSAGGMPAALPSEGFRKTPALDPANGSIASPPDRADARRRSFGDDVSYRAPSPCGAWRRIESTPRKTAEKIGFVNSSSGSAHDSPHRCACPDPRAVAGTGRTHHGPADPPRAADTLPSGHTPFTRPS